MIGAGRDEQSQEALVGEDQRLSDKVALVARALEQSDGGADSTLSGSRGDVTSATCPEAELPPRPSSHNEPCDQS